MAKERIRITKESYRKDQIVNLVDTEFKTFVKPAPPVDTDTVEELFRLYDKLFYTIPLKGESNSHEYLLISSSEVTDFEKTTQDIQPLLNEISQLKQQVLDLNQQLFELDN